MSFSINSLIVILWNILLGLALAVGPNFLDADRLKAEIYLNLSLPPDFRFDCIFLSVGTNDLTWVLERLGARDRRVKNQYDSIEDLHRVLMRSASKLHKVFNVKEKTFYCGPGPAGPSRFCKLIAYF